MKKNQSSISPAYTSVEDWAAKCGITVRAANKRIKTFDIPRGPDGGIDAALADKIVLEKLDTSQQRLKATGDEVAETQDLPPEGLNEARLRRESAKADSARVEADLALGNVIKIDDVMQTWGALISPAKTRLMSLGARVGPMVAIEADAAACQAMIDGAVYEALAEIANYGRTN